MFSLNDNAVPSDDEGNAEPLRDDRSLVRTTKSVVIRSGEVGEPDPSVVSPHFFNAFHHAIVGPDEAVANVTVGITSAHAGEGKTTVAANIAVSTALATERETLLVDFNPRYPRIHSTFRVDIRPGLADAMVDPVIAVVQTTIKHLSLVTAGNFRRMGIAPDGEAKRRSKTNGVSGTNGTNGSAGLTFLSDFRDVLYSLQRQFAFIIVDMSSATDPFLPLLFMQQMHGLVVVIDSNRTKREDVDFVVHRLGAARVRGFVLNRVERST